MVVFPNRPAEHNPLHNGDDKPAVLPYRPMLQFEHVSVSPLMYVPALQTAAVGDVDPGGHTKLALHGPEHDDDVSPEVEP